MKKIFDLFKVSNRFRTKLNARTTNILDKRLKKTQVKKVIIRIDGGICSQINFCALGVHLESLGYKVKYDLSWFKESGLDCLNKFVRNYDMEKAFPDLKFEIATSQEIEDYKKIYTFVDTIPLNGESGYICGYPPERNDKPYMLRNYFMDAFHPIDVDSCNDILQEIEAGQSCAVHVRRGDLAVYNPAYGYPTPKEYYIKAINIIHKLHPKVKFFFFSEECDWIKNELLPELGGVICCICNKNGADKGYLDLYLMSKSDYLIASSGSLARMAKILSNSTGEIILDKYDKNIVEHCENVIVLNDTILLNSKMG